MELVAFGGEGDDADLSASAERAEIAAVPFDVEAAGVADNETGMSLGGEGLALVRLEHAAENAFAIGGNGEPRRFLGGEIEGKAGGLRRGGGRGYWSR